MVVVFFFFALCKRISVFSGLLEKHLTQSYFDRAKFQKELLKTFTIYVENVTKRKPAANH